MRSTFLIIGALGAVFAWEDDRTSTVINTETLTVTSCGVGCGGHGASTATVPGGAVSTPCTKPVASTLVTSVIPPPVSATSDLTTLIAITPTGAISVPSYGSTVPAVPTSVVVPTSIGSGPTVSSYEVPTSASPTSVATVPVVPSYVVPTSAASIPSYVVPSSVTPAFTNGTTSLLIASSSASHHTSTSVVTIGSPTAPAQAPSSSAPGLNGGPHVVVPGAMLSILAMFACVFA